MLYVRDFSLNHISLTDARPSQWLESTVEPETTVYDDVSGSWSLKIRRADGSVRQMKCHHIVQATGHS